VEVPGRGGRRKEKGGSPRQGRKEEGEGRKSPAGEKGGRRREEVPGRGEKEEGEGRKSPAGEKRRKDQCSRRR